MKVYVLVVGADLRVDPDYGKTRVGPETARVCRKAAEVASSDRDVMLLPAAGYAQEYHVIMSQVMAEYLIHECFVSTRQVRSLEAKEFNTCGEVMAFAEHMVCNHSFGLLYEECVDVTVVARWWHLPRVRMLLTQAFWDRIVAYNFPTEIIGRIHVHAVPVWLSFDLVGMLREIFALGYYWWQTRRA